LHALQQRQFAVVVEINAHAEVDLVRVGVGGELFVQTQNRVAGSHGDGGKQRHGESSGAVRVVKSVAAVEIPCIALS
jgi:hypothetical protein